MKTRVCWGAQSRRLIKPGLGRSYLRFFRKAIEGIADVTEPKQPRSQGSLSCFEKNPGWGWSSGAQNVGAKNKGGEEQ